MLRRRPGGFPYPKAKLVGLEGTPSPTGAVPVAEQIFGTHAAQIYGAEGLKSQVWGSVRTAIAASGVATFVSCAPQVYADVQPDLYPPATTTTKPIGVFQSTAPQFDYSQPAVFARPAFPQGPVPPAQWARQDDPTQLQPDYSAPLSAGPGALGDYPQTAEQFQDRPTVAIWRSATGPLSGILGVYVTTPPQAFDYTLPGQVETPTFSPQGYLIPVLDASGQDSFQPAVAYFPSAAASTATTGKLGTFSVGSGQFEERPTQVAWPSQKAGATPAVPPFRWTPQQSVDFTLQPAYGSSQSAPPLVTGPTVSPYAVPGQFDISINASVVWTPSTFSPSKPAAIGLHQVNMGVSFGIGLGRMGVT